MSLFVSDHYPENVQAQLCDALNSVTRADESCPGVYGHTEASSTEVYTRVFVLDVGYQRGVRFTVPVSTAGLQRIG